MQLRGRMGRGKWVQFELAAACLPNRKWPITRPVGGSVCHDCALDTLKRSIHQRRCAAVREDGVLAELFVDGQVELERPAKSHEWFI